MAETSRWRETVGHGFGTGRNKGGTKSWDVLHEDTGRVGGSQTEHWDGRVDAEIRPESVKMKIGLQPKEDA
jgi:hypothetical protein